MLNDKEQKGGLGVAETMGGYWGGRGDGKRKLDALTLEDGG